MKSMIFVFLMVLVSCRSVVASGPDTLWTRTYNIGGTANTDCGFVIKQTPDGGYIASGLNQVGNFDIPLLKLDEDGDTIWTHLYGTTAYFEEARAIDQTADGGYIIAGSRDLGHNQPLLLKTDGAGAEEWMRDYTFTEPHFAGGVLRAVHELPDGDLFAAGTAVSGGGSAPVRQFMAMRLSSIGDTIWTHQYGGPDYEGCNDAILTPDGNALLVGFTNSFGAVGKDIWVLKITLGGDSLWSRRFGSSEDELCNAVIQTLDGGYALTGNDGSNLFLMKLNGVGDSVTYQEYPSGYGSSIRELPNGDLSVAGVNNRFGQDDFWLLRTSSALNLIWSTTVGGTEPNACQAHDLTNDGGYILSGFTQFAGGNLRLTVARFGPDHALCGNLTGTLAVHNSPYDISCDLLIPAGDTLTIEPGVRLNFTGPYKFEVRGTLIAEGTAADSIVFTTEETAENRWHGLRFYDATSSSSRLDYCAIEKGNASSENGANRGGGIFCNLSSPTFTHCSIRNNTTNGQFGGGGGISCINASPVFESCAISGNYSSGNGNTDGGGGIELRDGSNATFSRCAITDNEAFNTGGGIGISAANGLFEECSVSGNTCGWGGGGLAIYRYSNPVVINCTFVDNASTVTIGGGIWLQFSVSPIFRNLIVAHSTNYGMYLHPQGYNLDMTHCDFWDNLNGNFYGPTLPGLGNVTTTNRNGDPCDAYYNLYLDPRFVNAGTGNYHLQSNSPCIDAGDPTMFDPDCTPSDIGAFYVFHLPQPDSLVVQRDGWNMHLAWSVVDSTECGHPTPIRSYAVFYKQVFNETWNFLAATPDTFYNHANVVHFAPSMYYEVIATDIDVETIRGVTRPGMTKEEFSAAVER